MARVLYLGRVVMCDEIVKTHTVGFMLWKSFSERWKVTIRNSVGVTQYLGSRLNTSQKN